MEQSQPYYAVLSLQACSDVKRGRDQNLKIEAEAIFQD